MVEGGVNLPSGKNHADYINLKGHYDIVSYLGDHATIFPSKQVVVVVSCVLTLVQR